MNMGLKDNTSALFDVAHTPLPDVGAVSLDMPVPNQ